MVMAFGILTISTGSIMVRYAQEYAPSLVIAALRLFLATVVLTPMALVGHRAELATLTRRELALAGLSGFFLSLHFAFWIVSLEYTNVASSVVLATSTPLYVALFAPFTIRERASRTILMGIALALVGGVVVGLSDACSLNPEGLRCPEAGQFFHGEAVIGDILATLAAVAAAAYVLIGRRLRAKLSLVGYITLVYGVAAMLLLVVMFASGSSPFGYPPVAYFWILLLALVPQLLGHSSFNWALGYASAALVSVALLVEPIGATLLAYIFLGETPTSLRIIGAILVLIGVYIASRGEN